MGKRAGAREKTGGPAAARPHGDGAGEDGGKERGNQRGAEAPPSRWRRERMVWRRSVSERIFEEMAR